MYITEIIGGIIFLVMIGLVMIGLVVFILFFYLPSIELEECQQAAPEHYETISHYNIFGEFNCLYETLPQYEYAICSKTLGKTENHGKITTVNTCTKARFDLNRAVA